MVIERNKVDDLGETALTRTLRPDFPDGYGETGEMVKILLENTRCSCFRQGSFGWHGTTIKNHQL